jgi:uncharacterized OB-fold protein
LTDQRSPSRTFFPFPEGEWKGPIPTPDIDSEAYWQGLKEHELRILHCQVCGHWVHYPLAVCPRCHSFELKAEPIGGTGTVYSFTVTHRQFVPGVDPPYAVAVVEIDEEPGVRMLTNLVNCYEDEIEIGMRVRAVFKDVDEQASLAFFEPERSQA